ncbi:MULTISPECIES: flagellar biosynthetic protein FliO [unclassified Duganella]|uniref:flagellar biosynthetic protein FliO n=1 Tax=unclassified Duganella TaxID=2636909 RepID=UPI000E3440DD|nr:MULTISPECIES: flagellar biosynthetic protein FliO [unclassified Duganella]RFP14818.1 flagellar biosynthetic protein FliO [Duganella sp. BJB475]RFP31168.1 flagellar biosynthetic protein FliO [Duganella sp. BJB476]
MKHGLTFPLILAAALAAAPAMAQRSVSGTIGGQHAASAPVAATAAPAATPPAAETPAAATATTAMAAPAEAPAAAAPAATAATAPPAPAGPLAMTIPTPQPSATSAGGGLLQTTFALIFVLALLIGLAWFLKRFGPKNFGGGNSNVKLVGALSVGARERILVVEVGEQWIVVGASPGRMNALATMPRQESSEPAATAALPTANFAEWFKQTIDKRNGK